MKQKNVIIDGKTYEIDKLSENLQKQIMSLRIADIEIERTRNILSMLKNSRSVYADLIKKELLAEA